MLVIARTGAAVVRLNEDAVARVDADSDVGPATEIFMSTPRLLAEEWPGAPMHLAAALRGANDAVWSQRSCRPSAPAVVIANLPGFGPGESALFGKELVSPLIAHLLAPWAASPVVQRVSVGAISAADHDGSPFLGKGTDDGFTEPPTAPVTTAHLPTNRPDMPSPTCPCCDRARRPDGCVA